MTSIGDVELRSIVKLCVALEKSPTETMKMINSTGKYKKCSPATVYRWHARFKEGNTQTRTILDVGSLAVVACSIKDSVKDSAYDLVKHTQAVVSSFTDSWKHTISGSADTENASKLQVTTCTLKRCDDRWT